MQAPPLPSTWWGRGQVVGEGAGAARLPTCCEFLQPKRRGWPSFTSHVRCPPGLALRNHSTQRQNPAALGPAACPGRWGRHRAECDWPRATPARSWPVRPPGSQRQEVPSWRPRGEQTAHLTGKEGGPRLGCSARTSRPASRALDFPPRPRSPDSGPRRTRLSPILLCQAQSFTELSKELRRETED